MSCLLTPISPSSVQTWSSTSLSIRLPSSPSNSTMFLLITLLRLVTYKGALNTCKSACTFDPLSAPIRHLSYWFLAYRWVSFRCRFTIKTVKSVVVRVSAHTLNSKHVAREVERADSNEKIIIPLLLEDVTASGPLEYYFGATQRVD